MDSSTNSIDYTYPNGNSAFYDTDVTNVANTSLPNQTSLSSRGILYYAGYSCSSLTKNNNNDTLLPSFLNNDQIPKIAIIKNGQCDLSDKIYNAQKYGAIACIIYNELNDNSIKIQESIPYNTSISIPAYIVSSNIGNNLYNQLINCLNNSQNISPSSPPNSNTNIINNNISDLKRALAVRVSISPPISGTPSALEITFLVVTIILTIGLIASGIMHAYLWRKNRRIQRLMLEEGFIPPNSDQLPMGKQLLDESKLNLFPTRIIIEQDLKNAKDKRKSTLSTLKNNNTDHSSQQDDEKTNQEKKEGDDDYDDDEITCVICLELYKEGQKVRQLPCEHEYHCDCIDPWLKNKSGECPLCKYDCVRHISTPEQIKIMDEAYAYYNSQQELNPFRLIKNRFNRLFSSSSNPQNNQS
ncbi:unnamed protein product [Cunninghamella blakesleeana]